MSADTFAAHNFTNCRSRPRRDAEPYILADRTAAIREWWRTFFAHRKSGRDATYATQMADLNAGAPLRHLVEDQQLLYAELLEGLRSPPIPALADLVPVSIELLNGPDFVKAIKLGWTARELFGVSLHAVDVWQGLGMAGFFLVQTEGRVPDGTVWGWNFVEVTLPDFGRKKFGPLVTDDTVPIWDHPRFRASRH